MATYRTAPNLGKPPAPETLSKRARRASAEGAARLRAASASRRFGSAADLERQARAAAKAVAVHGGPHPLPVELIDVAQLTGSAKSLAAYADGLGFEVAAARTAREVEVRIFRGEPGVLRRIGRIVFRDGRLVHAFALVDGQHVKRTLTALKAELAKAAA